MSEKAAEKYQVGDAGDKPTSEALDISEQGRKPKRIIHCSDGIIEEYSTDEEDGGDQQELPVVVDTSSLTWPSYFWHYTVTASYKTFQFCEYLGEKLAYFFGITSPKYQYAINEYYRLEKEEQDELQRQEKNRDEIRMKVAEQEAVKVYSSRTSAMATQAEKL